MRCVVLFWGSYGGVEVSGNQVQEFVSWKGKINFGIGNP